MAHWVDPDGLPSLRSLSELDAAGFATNHLQCPSCGAAARPAILMFGDGMWRDVDSQERRWFAWKDAVEARAAQAPSKQPLTVVILEIGAGNNVPTVRRAA